MAFLNQVIAIEKGEKARIFSAISDLNKVVQKADQFSGLVRTYSPLDDDGERLPPESKRVSQTVPDILRQVAGLMTPLFDVTAAKDYTNTVAFAAVEVDGVVLVEKAPVTYLLFLEKQLTDLRTLFGNLPVLDDSESWSLDENSLLYRAAETKTHRSKKVSKPIVLYPATEHHPAQTQLITEDQVAGYWTMVKQSGAIPKAARQKLVDRVNVLLVAVKRAREAANMTRALETEGVFGRAIFDFLLGG